jgi:hypothetical protein
MNAEHQPVNYRDGQSVRLGDRVKLGTDPGGIVVAVIDTGEYTAEFSEAAWGYLGAGILINFPKFGLIHYKCQTDLEIEPDLTLLSRAP